MNHDLGTKDCSNVEHYKLSFTTSYQQGPIYNVLLLEHDAQSIINIVKVVPTSVSTLTPFPYTHKIPAPITFTYAWFLSRLIVSTIRGSGKMCEGSGAQSVESLSGLPKHHRNGFRNSPQSRPVCIATGQITKRNDAYTTCTHKFSYVLFTSKKMSLLCCSDRYSNE